MPAPVTHIVLALAILPMLPDKKRDKFLIGTSFPDIRYLGVLAREQTHIKNPSWHSVQQEPSAFKAGMEFHALVDHVHDQYMAEQKVYEYILAPSRFKSYVLKLYEDMILYEYCDDWSNIVVCFDTILDDELAFYVEKSSVETWHKMLQWYFCDRPTMLRVVTLLTGRGFALPDVAKDIFEKAIQGLGDKKVREIVSAFYEQFPVLLSEAEQSQVCRQHEIE